jgi:anti-sigma B factor antagonist
MRLLDSTIRARFALHEPRGGWFNRPVSDDSISPLREPPVRSVESVDGAVVLHLAGELDLYNADELRAALADALAQGPARIVVEMSEVEFIDSTALGVLIEARSKVGTNGLLLAAPQLETRRTLRVSGLDRHLAVHDSVADALAV